MACQLPIGQGGTVNGLVVGGFEAINTWGYDAVEYGNEKTDNNEDTNWYLINGSKYTPKITVKTVDGTTYTAKTELIENINGTIHFGAGMLTETGEVYDILSDASRLDLRTAEVTLHYAGDAQEEGDLNSLEAMLADLITATANALNWIVSISIGKSLTIDDLVFDNYDLVELSYFKESGDSKLIWGENADGNPGDGTGGLHETINEWYGIFLKIAIIFYMIMLIYMGIRIMLSSTGEKKAQYKTLFIYWVIGAVILFFYPFVMKYSIELNVAFVKILQSAKSGNFPPPSQVPAQPKNLNGLASMDFNESPYETTNDNVDYMTSIAIKAQQSRRLALALAYMIMTWQLITLTVHYYKRLLMVGFLIVIFPLVAISFAVDKIADGKSQSFNKWNKEFTLNVFIQSFHAIVYLFVCNTVYSASTGNNYDFMLVIVGVTFLFTGEEIIKKIFSQESKAGTMGSLATTAAASLVAVQATKKLVSNVASNTVGKNSLISKVNNAKAEYESSNKKVKLFDELAKPVERPNAGLRLNGTQEALNAINNDGSLSDAEKVAKRNETMQLANAIADVNNPGTRSAKELADAYDIIQSEMTKNPNNPLFNNMKLTQEQMQGMSNINRGVAQMVANGITDTVTIEREVKLRMGYVLEGLDNESMTRYNTMFLTSMALHGVNRGFTRASTESEIDNIIEELEEIDNSFNDNRIFLTDIERLEIEGRESIYASELMQMARSTTSRDGADNDTEERVAKDIAIIHERAAGSHSYTEMLDAIDEVIELRDTNDTTDAMVNALDDDVNVMRHLIAQKIVSSEDATDEEKNRAQQVINDYEENVRDGFYDDEISIHDVIKRRKEEEIDQMRDEIHLARRRTNQREKELTQDIAADILAENGVTLTEGGLDTTTRYLDGQTREEILLEQKAAQGKMLKKLLGMKAESVDEGLDPLDRYQAYRQFSDEEDPSVRRSFWERMGDNGGLSIQQMLDERRRARRENYNAHFMGDQNNNNNNNDNNS